MSSPLLSVEKINVFYGGIHALHDVSMHVDAGEIVSIIGANGAGKSTLMRSIAGDKNYKDGSILLDGAQLPNKAHQVAAKGISLVPEGRRIFVNLTVKENLRVGAFLEKKKSVLDERFEEVFTIFPRLKERMNQNSGTLSGGEQQMLAVGRALMARPRLMMLDEPSLGLAPIVIDEMFEKFRQINKELGISILLVEQNAFIAIDIANRCYILSQGRMTREGTSEAFLHDSEIQQAFMGVK